MEPLSAEQQAHVDKIVRDRVNEVKAALKVEVDTARSEAKAARDEAAAAKATAVAGEAALKELADLKGAAERAEIFAEAGVTDPVLQARLAKIHEGEQIGAESPADLRSWLGTAKEDPVWSRLLPDPAAPAAPGAVPITPRPAPITSTGSPKPPPPGVQPSKEVLRAKMREQSAAGKHEEARATFEQLKGLDAGSAAR